MTKKEFRSGKDLSWIELNRLLQEVTDEAEALHLLNEEKALAVPRSQRLVRLHSRYNRLRSIREKGELR